MKHIVRYYKDTGLIMGVSSWRENGVEAVERRFSSDANVGAIETDVHMPNPADFKVVDGVVVPLEQSVLDERAREEAMKSMRIERNALLAASDYTQLGDSPRNKQAWASYRQQLRDLPSTVTDPFNVTWPEPPQQ